MIEPDARRRPITVIQADSRRPMDGGTAYALAASRADSTRCRLQSTPRPTLETADVAAGRSLVSLAVR